MSDKKLIDSRNFPAFRPDSFEIRTQIYDDTGGGCMVGTVEFYLPKGKRQIEARLYRGGREAYTPAAHLKSVLYK